MEEQTFIIKTLGCKVNQYETQIMREQLLSCGYKEIDDHSIPAALYIINTCTVTHKADKESRELIRSSIKTSPHGKVIVTGCYVEKDADEILKIPGAIQIVKNEQKDKLLSFLRTTHYAQPNTQMGITHFKDHTRGFVKIQEGCDNFCSYCKVALVRGKPKSRDLSLIIKETKQLIENGFKEIVLCGICLGAYGRDCGGAITLTDVLGEIEKLDRQFRIRLSSIEMQDVTDKLVDKIANSDKICRHLHIPLQSGDDYILKIMNRRYMSSDFKEIIFKIKSSVSDFSLTTDILVGFPGETEERFKNTLNLLREINPSRIHVFGFSPRKGTVAEKLPDRIAPALIKKRVDILIKFSQALSLEYKQSLIGKSCDVLIETKRDKRTGLLMGYSSSYIKIFVDASDSLMNNIVEVNISQVDSSGNVFGEINNKEAVLCQLQSLI